MPDILDEVLNNEAFSAVSPERLTLFREMCGKLDGKPPMEAMAVFGEYMPRLQTGGKMSDSERHAMVDAICGCLAEKDAAVFRNMLKLAESVKASYR
jgi:hypothetical protein